MAVRLVSWAVIFIVHLRLYLIGVRYNKRRHGTTETYKDNISGGVTMAEIYFTIAGTNHHHGQEFIEPKMEVKLVKEPDNEVDKEAIKVEMPGIGLIGYVANSPYTVIGESFSAGRLYDKIGDTARGTVLYVLPKGVLCVLNEEEIVTAENLDK